jgi:predicted nucleic acid-binding protein
MACEDLLLSIGGRRFAEGIDAGEKAAIQLAISLNAGPLPMDDRMIAKE